MTSYLPGGSRERAVCSLPLIRWFNRKPFCRSVWSPWGKAFRWPRWRNIRWRGRNGYRAWDIQRTFWLTPIHKIRRAYVQRGSGAAMLKLLSLLPLIELPNSSVLICFPFLLGHLQVADTVLCVLVVTRQVAVWWRRWAPWRLPGILWQSVIVLRKRWIGALTGKSLIRSKAAKGWGEG